MFDLSIIIPASNEAKRIGVTLDSIAQYLQERSQQLRAEVIIVENNCTDNTAEVALSYQAKIPGLRVLRMSQCGGKGEAVRTGMLAASGDFVLFMDADNATHISEIDAFEPLLRADVDVVIGSRHVKGSDIRQEQPLLRRFMGRVANLLIQIVLLPGIQDTQCGFKVFRRDVARDIFSVQQIVGWGFDIEILAIARNRGYRIKEMPVRWFHVGGSRLRPLKDSIHTLRDLFLVKRHLLRGEYAKKM